MGSLQLNENISSAMILLELRDLPKACGAIGCGPAQHNQIRTVKTLNANTYGKISLKRNYPQQSEAEVKSCQRELCLQL